MTLPFDFGSQRVSTTGDPDEPVTWRVALPGEYINDASAHIQFESDFASGEIPVTGAGGGFIVGDMPERAEADLDGRQSLVDAVVNIPAGSLQELGTGNHAITGNMIVTVAPEDAHFLPADAERLEEGSYRLPVTMTADVYTPIDWGQLARYAAIGLAALAALVALWLIRPGLPANAALMMYGTRYPIRSNQSSIGNAGDDVDIGLGRTAGTVSGGWFKRANFRAAHDNVSVDGTGLEEGQSVPLGSHAMIVADSTHFEFTTEKPAADGDGDGFGDGYGTN